MARKPMVTRTFVTTVANVLCMNLETAEPFNTEVTFARTFKDDKKLMKAVSEKLDTETVKAVHIVGKEERETLYGMTEDDFLRLATELDKETRKPITTDAVAENATENED